MARYEQVVIPFDNRGWKYPGMGFLNVENDEWDEPAEAVVTITTEAGVFKSWTRTFQPGELWWFSLVHEHPDLAQKVGTVTVTPVEKYSGAFAGFSLQYAPNGAYTAVIPFER